MRLNSTASLLRLQLPSKTAQFQNESLYWRGFQLTISRFFRMGAEGLEPSRPFKVNGFSFSRSFRYCLKGETKRL